jgi:dTDP-4-dehydrorhamnose 3,5-epimerase
MLCRVAKAMKSVSLPDGVTLRQLQMQPDERGRLTEMYRVGWAEGFEPVQWNVVTSNQGVLRGVHVHTTHHDYLVVIKGRATIGLRDLRPGPSSPWVGTVEMSGERIEALSIPPGVAHGFYFHEPSIFIYGTSHFWNPQDELCCHWADPELEIPWPASTATLSERDASAPPLRELLAAMESGRPF